jgi:glycerol-3-phosphate acyltransferase PlsY
MALVGALVVAYLLGSIPTADVVTRLVTRGTVDIRTAGTGNPGAANALKVLGAKWGALILLVDIGKAAAACVLAWMWVDGSAANWAGTAAVVGHCYPVWSRGRGGKGIACSVGQCIVTFPAYFPFDLMVAVLASRASSKNKAYGAAMISSALWVVGATLWVALDLPNGWGPTPGVALPLAAAASSAVIVQRFVAESGKSRPTELS